jgi:hypothetical protein
MVEVVSPALGAATRILLLENARALAPQSPNGRGLPKQGRAAFIKIRFQGAGCGSRLPHDPR